PARPRRADAVRSGDPRAVRPGQGLETATCVRIVEPGTRALESSAHETPPEISAPGASRCRGRDSNPHGHGPLDFESSASTDSATSAKARANQPEPLNLTHSAPDLQPRPSRRVPWAGRGPHAGRRPDAGLSGLRG